jgi:hypothetical protein
VLPPSAAGRSFIHPRCRFRPIRQSYPATRIPPLRKYVLAPLFAAALATLGTGCANKDPVANVPSPTLMPPRYPTTPPAPPRHWTPSSQTTPQRQYAPAQPYRPNVAGVPRDWIPQAKAHQWKYIVIHHSDTKVGSAASFDRYHREVRKWDSLGYHFVIGNGSLSGDGQVEAGKRWVKQMTGAHAGVKEFNENGIGICLVGDFSQTRPTAAEMRSLAKLVGHLMKTYRIPPNNVLGHNDAKDGKTNCPGKYMNVDAVKRMAVQYAGVEEWILPTFAPLAASPETELLRDAE